MLNQIVFPPVLFFTCRAEMTEALSIRCLQKSLAMRGLIWYCGFLPDVTRARLLTFYIILDVWRRVYRRHFTASRPIFSHADVDVFIKVLLICSLL